jgi:hypothetical protein
MISSTYSIPYMLSIYNDNREYISAHLKGDVAETFVSDNSGNDCDLACRFAMYGGVTTFLILLLAGLVVYVWALVALINNWKRLSTVVKIIGVLGLLTGVGPIVTLIAVYGFRK